jgi:hypothetical protein
VKVYLWALQSSVLNWLSRASKLRMFCLMLVISCTKLSFQVSSLDTSHDFSSHPWFSWNKYQSDSPVFCTKSTFLPVTVKRLFLHFCKRRKTALRKYFCSDLMKLIYLVTNITLVPTKLSMNHLHRWLLIGMSHICHTATDQLFMIWLVCVRQDGITIFGCLSTWYLRSLFRPKLRDS